MNKYNYKETEYNTPFIYNRADPQIYRHSDGMYYFTASVPEYDRLILRKSDSIKGLREAEEKIIWRKHSSGKQSIHIWAPELHYLWGKWYIYYAAGDKDDIWAIRPYVLACTGNDPIRDEWIELGQMQAAEEDEFSFLDFSLDATVMLHNGEYYYIWAEKTGTGKKISNLYIARMEAPDKLSTPQELLSKPDYPWERSGFWVNEGPAVLKHNGRIYLTYSASDTGKAYCMGMLSVNETEDILDPNNWSKRITPVLCTDEKKGIFGPGHNSFVKSDDGKKDICVFHARCYDEIEGDPLYDPNRHTMMIEVQWDEKGEPVLNLGKIYRGE
ncbi:MAG: family 43 glycosylhydrolase [Faecalicatena sp.]|uniref:family 43 glycosylhydrolase n=1 Tax=Faecalicatena sp. TaxID=2005360 RepID=UPI0025854180|nr:family 43 glycosylhydrolase [Faecalicatena sp.]MCI6122321.1 family 43 glycosylhydrolase [Lachnospiraceae bacterium]MCI6464714.1 family 43 glycosylhydrolase [Faecalicatena sp.]MDY5618292.1 family 43 glycosylhydrolase [Lachnospiraceae bacterium]